jgi:LPXTG-motif cell wall-anchored protein
VSSTRLYRLALPAALVALLAAALFTMTANALATTTTIPINSGNVPIYAADVPTQICSANQGGGPYADKDVWVFVLPGNHSTSGDFVSVTLQFDTNGDNVADLTLSITADGGGFLNGGPQVSKAWIATPAGYQLIDGSAVITGTADSFNLSHTCPASGPTPSPSPSGSTPTTEPPTTQPPTTEPVTTPPTEPSSVPPTSEPVTTPPTETPPTTPPTEPSSVPPTTTRTTSSPTGSPSTSVPTEPSSTPSTTTTPLPTTGAALSGILLAGVAMIVVGAALLVARRRRDATASNE